MFSFSREDTSLVAKWWRNIDKQILFLFVFLLLLGLFFSFSSTSSLLGEKMHKETYFFFHYKSSSGWWDINSSPFSPTRHCCSNFTPSLPPTFPM